MPSWVHGRWTWLHGPQDRRQPPEDDKPSASRRGGRRVARCHRQPHTQRWSLPDGTGLHAPVGHLVSDGETRLCCHLCGRWFIALGGHLRVHGYTAEQYREAMGLGVTTPLVATALSQRIAERRKRSYRGHADVRQRLAPGRQMALDGRLNQRARATLDRGPEPPERVRVRATALDTGRHTQARRRAEALDHLIRAAGAGSLSDYLRREYTAGASLASLARSTGLGHARLRTALDDAGVVVRPTGQNTAAGRRSRALTSTAAAAARVGTDDLHVWLAQRHNDG